MQSFWKALFFVFISEMGDKTQVVSFVFGAQYGLATVLAGVLLGIVCMMTITVTIGNLLSTLLPIFWINIASGVLFIAFGLWALKQHEEAPEKTVGSKFGTLAAVTATFVLAELGDKTILASLTIASQQHAFFPVWLGSVLGMFLADLIAIVSGRIIGKQLPDKLLRYGSAAIFFAAGVYTIYSALTQRA